MTAGAAVAENVSSVPRERIICPLSNKEIVDRILKFVEGFTGYEFYLYQALFARRIVESVLGHEGSVVTGLWCRQSGKTETVADTCVSLAVILPCLAREFPDDPRFMPFKNGFLIGIYAPIQDQAQIPFNRMRQRVHSKRGTQFLMDPELAVGVVQSRGDLMKFTNGSEIRCKSASPDSNIEGATHHLVIIEESQKVSRSKVEKEISPMLASTNGTMVKIGTAWVSRGGFHTSIQQNIEAHENGGPRNHFEFPYDIVIAEKQRAYDKEVRELGAGNPFHLNYAKYIAGELIRVGGEDSEEFKMNFRCVWQESRLVAINEKVFRDAALNLEAGPMRFGYQVAGLDIGKTNDSSVLTIMEIDMAHPIINPHTLPGADEQKQVYHRKVILDWLELYGSFEGSTGQYQTVVDYLRQTNVQILVIDSTAMGDPVFERLEAMLGGTIMCVPYKFNVATKSNLYKHYLTEVNSRRVFYAAGENTKRRTEYMRFQQQHYDLDKSQAGNYIVVQASEEEGHDDYPDSAALACWAETLAEQVKMATVTSSAPSSPGRRGRQVSGQQVESKAHLVKGSRAGRYVRRW